MTRIALAACLLTACGQLGLSVDVSAKDDVPPLDSLRVQVMQGDLLVAQTLPLAGKTLPQSVAIVSKGMTHGTVIVVVQGLAKGRVEAAGTATGELKSASSGAHVAVVLARVCVGTGGCGCDPMECALDSCGTLDDGCGGQRECAACSGTDVCTNNKCVPTGCTKKSCGELGAQCGSVSDSCDGRLDCGPCDAGTCGAQAPNQCGQGPCMPRTHCDAGMTCGTISDGCSGSVSCGTCGPDAGTCGGGGVPLKCGCTKATACPSSKVCGQWPDGCGGMLNCGGCDAGTTCAGGGLPNQCGCTPLTVCPAGACNQWPNGCGGTLNCSGGCGPQRVCRGVPDGGSGFSCQCNNNTVDCAGTCSDLATDELNCGSCGNTCPSNQQCRGGLCPCVDAGSNIDGHCCPPGWFMSFHVGQNMYERCFKGPYDAGTQPEAIIACQQATAASFGRAISALGAGGQETTDEFAAPNGACASLWMGPTKPQRVTIANGNVATNTTCSNTCVLGCPDCSTCPCDTSATYTCDQSFYCVMDPLGPRVEGPCASPADCPAGMTCTGGNCVASGHAFCSVDADCTGTGFATCASRGGSQTGLCQ